jgi:hypothetical protein
MVSWLRLIYELLVEFLAAERSFDFWRLYASEFLVLLKRKVRWVRLMLLIGLSFSFWERWARCVANGFNFWVNCFILQPKDSLLHPSQHVIYSFHPNKQAASSLLTIVLSGRAEIPQAIECFCLLGGIMDIREWTFHPVWTIILLLS